MHMCTNPACALQVNVPTGQQLEFHLEAYLSLALNWEASVMTEAMAQESEPFVQKRVMPAQVNKHDAQACMPHAHACCAVPCGAVPCTMPLPCRAEPICACLLV